MKKIITCAMLLTMAATSFYEKINSKLLVTSEEYLRKSKGQKSGGWLLLCFQCRS